MSVKLSHRLDHSHHNLELQKNTLLLGDCVRHMQRFPDESVDMIFADPPYNLQLKGDLFRPDKSKVIAVDEAWDKYESFKAYDESSKAWLGEARRILKPNGTIWVIGSYHNIFRIGAVLQDTGYWILNDIIWNKVNPMPNFRGRRFTNAHETLIWAAKDSNSRYTFNYQSMKIFNDDLQMRSDWHLPICSGGERIKNHGGSRAHPTQKPEALLARVILASTNVGDVVLDPFLGTGTTAAVAKQLGRDWIGIEQDPGYLDVAEERVTNAEQLAPELLESKFTSAGKKRIPFGALLEQGELTPGDVLLGGSSKKHKAVVRVDGSLSCGDNEGSIHKIGASLEGTQSCNGWQYWHIERDGKLHPIDKLREKIRVNFEGKLDE